MEPIKGRQPVNIFDLIDRKEEARHVLMNKTCAVMKQMKDEGKTPEEIEAQIKRIDLPLDIHMAVFGRFTEICKYGRPLTIRERKLYYS